jgi:DNA polymerase-4
MKAAARLRRMEYCAAKFSVSARIENGPRLGLEAVCDPAQDTFTFLHLLDEMWRQMMAEGGNRRLKKVGVVLHGLVPQGQAHVQGDLFAAQTPAADLRERAKCDEISKAMDKLNRKFGKDTILLGMTPERSKNFTGTKIAFTRIPDMEEFAE